MPPVGLAFWRWTLGALLVLPFAWRHLAGDADVLRRNWAITGALAMLGIGVFNTFVYIGLNSTSVLNSVMMQSGIPPLIVLMTFSCCSATRFQGCRVRHRVVAGRGDDADLQG